MRSVPGNQVRRQAHTRMPAVLVAAGEREEDPAAVRVQLLPRRILSVRLLTFAHHLLRMNAAGLRVTAREGVREGEKEGGRNSLAHSQRVCERVY